MIQKGKTKDSILRKLSEYFSRKFILSGGSLIGSFILVWNDKEVGELLGVIATILGSYNGANVAESYINSRKPKEPKSPIEPEESPPSDPLA